MNVWIDLAFFVCGAILMWLWLGRPDMFTCLDEWDETPVDAHGKDQGMCVCDESVQSLRNKGYKVRVSHHRLFKNDSGTECYTRHEWEESGQTGDYHANALPTGGFTTVEVTKDNVSEKSKFNFHKKANYWKKRGVSECLNKLNLVMTWRELRC